MASQNTYQTMNEQRLYRKLADVPPYQQARCERALLKGRLALDGKLDDVWGYIPPQLNSYTRTIKHVDHFNACTPVDRLVDIVCEDKRSGERKHLMLTVYSGIASVPGKNQIVGRQRCQLHDPHNGRMASFWADGMGSVYRGSNLDCDRGVLDTNRTVILPNLGQETASLGEYRILKMAVHRRKYTA